MTVSQQIAPNFFRVTLVRSLIGLPWMTRNVAKALKLEPKGLPTYVPMTVENAGRIFRLKNIVTLQNTYLPPEITPEMAMEQEGLARKPHLGYRVVGSALNPSWHTAE